jgi:response regulator RpfG family c-di-GMP phosphodiesterase
MMENSEKQKVLIVDDAPEVIQILVETLKDEYKIIAANNGEKALALAAVDPAPDIILLDVMMPGMDGYEVCTKLKSNKKTAEIPVIFVTSMDDVEDETWGFAVGAADYITKPVRPPIVRARVKTHLDLRNARQKLQDLLNKTSSGASGC